MDYEIVCSSDNREEWLKARREGIGGSDAPALLGLVPWASPSSVQADKWGLLDEPDDAEVMRWGRRLESVIGEGLSEEMGEPVKPFGKLVRSTQHPYMICTPDAQLTDGRFVQIKNSVRVGEWQDGPPEYVWVQVQHEMAVTDQPSCIVAALLLGNRLRWCEVQRDGAFVSDVLIPAEREFWRLTQAQEPCPADGSDHTKRALQALYPQDSGETVTLDGSFLDLDAERLALLEEKKAATDRIREIDNAIRHELKDATFGGLPDGTVYSLKTQTRKEHVVKESTFRVLRRKGVK